MTKVHPNSAAASAAESPEAKLFAGGDLSAEVATMTVWRKSLLFNGNGFTVFDAKGNLAFRVDNYSSSSSRGEIVLMDAAGKPLLSFRRKKLSLGGQWLIYKGEETSNARFAVKKHVGLLPSRRVAQLTPCDAKGALSSSSSSYAIEGSYSRRSCKVYDERRQQPVAEVRRKEAAVGGVAFGGDVFRLVVHPGFDAPLAMALVIILEQMFGPRAHLLDA